MGRVREEGRAGRGGVEAGSRRDGRKSARTCPVRWKHNARRKRKYHTWAPSSECWSDSPAVAGPKNEHHGVVDPKGHLTSILFLYGKEAVNTIQSIAGFCAVSPPPGSWNQKTFNGADRSLPFLLLTKRHLMRKILDEQDTVRPFRPLEPSQRSHSGDKGEDFRKKVMGRYVFVCGLLAKTQTGESSCDSALLAVGNWWSNQF